MKTLPNLVRIAAVMLAALSVVLAFPLTRLLDSDLGATGASGFIITDSNGETTPEQLRAHLLDAAEEQQATIGIERVTADSSKDRQTLLVAPGAPGSVMGTWLTEGYTGFDPTIQVDARPLSTTELGDPGGAYRIEGSAEAVASITESVRALGFTASSTRLNWAYYLDRPLTVTVVAVLLLVGTLAAGGVFLRAREVAVERTHGHSATAIIGRRLIDAAGPFGITLLIAGLIACCALAAYNGFARAGLFAGVVGGLVGAGVLVAAAAIAGAVAALHLTPALKGLSGAVPGRTTIACVYIMRLCGVVILLTALGATLASAAQLKHQQQFDDAWSTRTQPHKVQIANTAADPVPAVGPALRRADLRGDLLLADCQMGLGRDCLLQANSEFAAQELGVSEAQLPEPGEVLALVPRGSDAALVERAQRSVHREADLSGNPAPEIRRLEVPAGRSAFVYNADPLADYDPEITDAVALVYPPGLKGFSDKNLTAAASRSHALMKSAEAFDRFRDDPSTSGFLGGHRPVADDWAQYRTDTQKQFRENAVNLVMLLLVVTACSVGSAAAYQARHRTRLRVNELLGNPPWPARAGLLLSETLFLLVPVAWLIYREMSYRATVPGLTPEAFRRALDLSPGLVAATAVTALGWSAVCLAMSARFGRIHSTTVTS